MASKAVTQQQTTQQKLQEQAITQLMIIGGALTNDDDIVFDGKAFVFPEQMRGDLPGIKQFVDRYIYAQSEDIVVQKTFEFRPMDGAHAVYHCLKQYFGYAQSKARNTPWGKEPPQEITINTGFVNGKQVTITVPWGDMVLPGLTNATLTVSSTRTRDKGDLLQLSARVRRVEKAAIDGFFIAVEEYLKENSIYKGKAFYGNMEFLDTDQIDPEQFVYSEDVWADAETLIFSSMSDAKILAQLGMEQKRVVLLEGPYGTGKSGLLRTSAKVAFENGYTAIIARPGVDDPLAVLQTARLYQPSLVAIEDIDVYSSSQNPLDVTRLLDAFDGFGTKDLQMILVMTTNHADRIHKGMLRPGRISGTISIGAMDRPGVEKLARIVVGNALEDDVNFDEVYEATNGYMPAYVREGLERSVRYSIARLRKVGRIATIDLVRGLHSLRAQLGLQDAAEDRREKLPPMDRVFRQMLSEEVSPPLDDIGQVVEGKVRDLIQNTITLDEDGDINGRLTV